MNPSNPYLFPQRIPLAAGLSNAAPQTLLLAVPLQETAPQLAAHETHLSSRRSIMQLKAARAREDIVVPRARLCGPVELNNSCAIQSKNADDGIISSLSAGKQVGTWICSSTMQHRVKIVRNESVPNGSDKSPQHAWYL
ncbi:MAG TPA: hypothetical protein PLG17_05045 [Thermodesulfobacteriota bacterium]|nr:hypothetical protein [Thermodesulfobacteriota bacterium]